jgi:hypothetical protein
MEPNPYEAPGGDSGQTRRRLGRVISVLSFFVAAIPSCVMLYWLGQHFLALYGSPTTSYRPIIWVYGLGLSVVNGILSLPFPLLAERLGTKADGELALLSMFFIPVPLLLGFVGPFVVCWATGSSFGT